MNVIRSPILISAVLLAAMVVSWSSGFIGYRYVADQGSVYLASVWRFILAAAVLLPLPGRVCGHCTPVMWPIKPCWGCLRLVAT